MDQDPAYSGNSRDYWKRFGKSTPTYYFLVKMWLPWTRNGGIWFFLSAPTTPREQITDALGVDPLAFDASRISSTVRHRYYWTNIPNIRFKISDKDILHWSQDVSVSQDHIATRIKSSTFTTGNHGMTGRYAFWEHLYRCFRTHDVESIQLTKNHRYNFVIERATGKVTRQTVRSVERALGFRPDYTNVAGFSDAIRFRMLGDSFSIKVFF